MGVACFAPTMLVELPRVEDGSAPGHADELLDQFLEDAQTLMEQWTPALQPEISRR
jgi:hypothetical protein